MRKQKFNEILNILMKKGINTVSLPILLIVATVILLCRCGGDHQIIFPQVPTMGIINGYIDPAGVKAEVFLVNVAVVDSVVPDSATGYFEFRNVNYGSYKVVVKADSFGTATTVVRLSSGTYTLGTMELNKYPSLMVSVFPAENSSISYDRSTFVNDSSVEFYFSFRKPINRETFLKNFVISPALPFKITKELISDYRHDIFIEIPTIYFFPNPKVTYTFKKGISTIYFETLEFDYSVAYFPDTSKISDVIFRNFFSSVIPQNNALSTSISTDLKMRFKKPMEHASVESALIIKPETKYEINWQKMEDGGELLTILFSELLKKGTTYNITIDTSARSASAVKLPRPVTTKFTTDPMKVVSYAPNSKEMYVSDSKTLTYSFSYPVDSASFLKAFSIAPTVDSLQLLLFDNKKTVMVLHQDFILDTVYTVTIDTSLMAYTGEHLSYALRQTFFTGVTDSIHSSSCVQKTFPSDPTNTIECDDDLIMTFTGAMDRSSVSTRISITPALPVDYTWLSTSTLQLKQLQQLRSNTRYTVTLDTGYTSLDHRVLGSGYVFKFETKPLRVTSYYPLLSQVNVPCKQDVMISFSTPVDTVSLLSKSYFNPPVDSIICLRDKDGKYFLKHAPFKRDTEYEYLLSDSIADKYGIVSGKSFSIKFKTGTMQE
jgi:hypothetical protein